MRLAKLKRKPPHYHYETQLINLGYPTVVGIDEVGRGSLAGPVVAAAVWLPTGFKLRGVRDSKLLSSLKREQLALKIKQLSLAVGVGWASASELEEHGLTWAVRQSGLRALVDLGCDYQAVILDGNHNYLRDHCEARAYVKADQVCLSVACASIVAKVARDAYMLQQHQLYPQYGFNTNKGYASAEHLQQLRQSVSPIHRRSYAPVRLALS